MVRLNLFILVLARFTWGQTEFREIRGGGEVELPCSSSGVSWTRNGVAVTSANERITIEVTGVTSMLTVMNATVNEGGVYQCLRENQLMQSYNVTVYGGAEFVGCGISDSCNSSVTYSPGVSVTVNTSLYFPLGISTIRETLDIPSWTVQFDNGSDPKVVECPQMATSCSDLVICDVFSFSLMNANSNILNYLIVDILDTFDLCFTIAFQVFRIFDGSYVAKRSSFNFCRSKSVVPTATISPTATATTPTISVLPTSGSASGADPSSDGLLVAIVVPVVIVFIVLVTTVIIVVAALLHRNRRRQLWSVKQSQNSSAISGDQSQQNDRSGGTRPGKLKFKKPEERSLMGVTPTPVTPWEQQPNSDHTTTAAANMQYNVANVQCSGDANADIAMDMDMLDGDVQSVRDADMTGVSEEAKATV